MTETEAECRCGCGQRPAKQTAEFVRGHRPPTPPAARFWQKITVDPSGCWIWTGAVGSHGYGSFWIESDRWTLAHRWAYESLRGEIAEGLEIDHLCRVLLCVNPAHLEPVTGAENRSRAMRDRPRVTECRHGHAYDEANTIINSAGYRECRTCRRNRVR